MSPTGRALPRAAWRVLRRAAVRAMAHQISFVASGVAFRVALAVFPAVALLVWTGGRLLDAAPVRELVQAAGQAVPDSTRAIIGRAVAASRDAGPSAGGGGLPGPAGPLIGLAFTLWSASSGMQALVHALNLTFEVARPRSWPRFLGVTLLLTLGALATLVCTMALALAVPHVLPPTGGRIPHALLRWPLMFGVFVLALAALYRFAPARDRGDRRFLTIGAAAAALVLLLTSGLFSWFIGQFASLAVTYGSLSTVVAFLIWLWLSVAIVLCGAELDAAIEGEAGREPRGG